MIIDSYTDGRVLEAALLISKHLYMIYPSQAHGLIIMGSVFPRYRLRARSTDVRYSLILTFTFEPAVLALALLCAFRPLPRRIDL